MIHYLKKLVAISIPLFVPTLILSENKDTLLETTHPQKPTWADSTIIEKGEFVFAIGHSQAQPTEEKAKDQALARATEEVVRYSGVTVEVFDRINESSSMVQGEEFYKSDFETKSRIRARAFVRRAVPVDWYIRKMKKKKEIYYKASVKLRVTQEEIKRIQAESEIKLSLDVGIYFENEQGELQYLSESDVLHSGDGYALYVRPSDPCYLYIYQVDDLNHVFRLFPNSEYDTADNPVPAGEDCWIPNTNQIFCLDETTGKERFFIFASLESIAELEGSVELKPENLSRKLKTMGLVGLRDKVNTYQVKAPQKQVKVADVKKKLQAEGAFVWETWFWHR
jgi:hypothetical protein